MRGGCESLESTVVYSMCWPLRGTEVCVSAAGWPAMFTTCMGGVRKLEIGENSMTAFGVFVEDATHLDTRNDKKETEDTVNLQS